MIRLCVVYRSTQMSSKIAYQQTRTSLFFQQFDAYLETLLQKNGKPILTGDFNFHVEDYSDLVAQRFVRICAGKGFKQHIKSPTHCAGGVLDLVFTAESTADCVILQDLQIDPDTGTASDHFLITFSIPVFLNHVDGTSYETITSREYDKIDIDSFKSDVSERVGMMQFQSVHEATDCFFNLLSEVIDDHAPIKSCKIKQNKNPWWNQKCRDARTERRKTERFYKKHKSDPVAAEAYKKARIDAAIIINKQRNDYYRSKLQRVAGNARETYKVINHLLDKENCQSKLPSGQNDKEVADNLKQFFNSKVRDIYSKIEEENHQTSLASFQREGAMEMQSFHVIDDLELMKIIDSMPNKQCKLDPIPMFLFKKCAAEMLPIISYIVNQSLQCGCFPHQLKTAIVSPILKKSDLDSDDLRNYRPISSMTYLSKILEKCVHQQLTHYLTTHSLLSNFQSGYRTNFSCETAITKIHNDVLLMVDSRTNVLLMLLDLSAAFDTINHEILIQKLEFTYGLKMEVLSWFKSYLSNRTFRVRVRNEFSEDCALTIGVPQGSILGPLLFVLYTKDLDTIVSRYDVKFHFYADDTQVYLSFDVHSDNPDISRLCDCYQDIKKWMSSCFLKLNEEKTEIMEIGPYMNKFDQICLGETVIDLVPKAKNLGFMFDDSMSLNEHLTLVTKKCNMALRNLRRIGSKLSVDLKVQLVHSSVLSHLDYCNAVLSALSQSQLNTLQKLQNSAVRFIFDLRKRVHIRPYLKKLHFLPVKERISFKIALLTFKALHGTAPEYISQLLRLKDPNSIYSLRGNSNPYILKHDFKPNFRGTYGAFSVKAPLIWNVLPTEIRSETKLDRFKKLLKTHFFEQTFYDVEDISI